MQQKPDLILSQKLKQEQILTPVQLQSLEILMAPIMELQAKISQELASNPILEQSEDSLSETVPADTDAMKPSSVEQGETRAEAPDDDDIESYGIGDDRDTDENDDHPNSENSTAGDADAFLQNDNYRKDTGDGNYSDPDKIDHFFNSIVDTPTIEEDLQFQLDMLKITPELKIAAETIIGNLDEKGYLNIPLNDISSNSKIPLSRLETALGYVQSLDPAGVGARSLQECLMLQIRRLGINDQLLEKIILWHLDDIAANHIPQVAKTLDISVDELNEKLGEVRKLSPYPYFGIADGNEQNSIVIPEVTISKNKDGQYVVAIEDKYQPRLKISERYLEMLENPATPQETKEYIRQKIYNAGMIIRSIEQRTETIKKIAEVITDTQFEFFENGIEHLKPLTMKQVADKIGMHETTVSRAVSRKYARTPQGVFELRYFFSSGYTSDAGDMISNKVVMEKIKDIINEEEPEEPYSDDAITGMLQNQGIPVARRTVAKYREMMNIPSSRLRRKFV